MSTDTGKPAAQRWREKASDTALIAAIWFYRKALARLTSPDPELDEQLRNGTVVLRDIRKHR